MATLASDQPMAKRSEWSLRAKLVWASKTWRVSLGAAALAWGVAASVSGEYLFDVSRAGLVFVAAGLVAWTRRPENRTGKLMVVCGYAFLFASWAGPGDVFWTLSYLCAQGVWPVALSYLTVSYPHGVATSLMGRRLVLFIVVINIFYALGLMLFIDPRLDGCSTCSLHENIFLVQSNYSFVRSARHNVLIPLVLLAICFWIATLAKEWRGASPPARRVLWPVYLPMEIYLVWKIALILAVFYLNFTPWNYLQRPEWILLMLIPLTFLLGLLRVGARRSRVGDLVVELGAAPSERFQEAVARTLGDPSVEVGFWSGELGRYVSSSGATVVPAQGGARVATYLKRGGAPLAVIVHDAALLEDPKLIESVSAAARLAVENERLQAEVRAQLVEVRASRSRIVAASDAERRRVERNLHDGAQQRLVSLAMSLRMAKAKAEGLREPELIAELEQSTASLDRAIAELRELAQGIHPAVLTEEGLAAALHDLVEGSSIRMNLSVGEERYPEPVEATAYFLISEALANAAKHARASSVSVSVTPAAGNLIVEIADDGLGGADPARGSGLRGLEDRVAALGGHLDIESPAAGGTRLIAVIPCESRSPTTPS